MTRRVIAVPVQGGKVAVNPQFQESLKQMGLDVNSVVQKIQDELKKYGKYPISKVELEVDQGKGYRVLVTLPPMGDLLLKLLGKDSGPHDAAKETLGDLPLERVAEIAILKRDELKSKTFRGALKQVLSTCKSMGITVEGKSASEVMRNLDSYEILKKYEDMWGHEPGT